MPKERLHMLLAAESLRLMESAAQPLLLDEHEKFSFLFGSIFPDTLFYDLPTLRLAVAGQSLHRFEGEPMLPFAEEWLQERTGGGSRQFRAWLLGLASHFLADGYFHPEIVKQSKLPCRPCRVRDLSARDCHHWLESELEGYWISRIGPPDGYFSLLDRFRSEARARGRYVGYYRDLLARAGLETVPRPREIARCLFWQTLLLREFAKRRWTRWKPWLLGSRRGRFWGSLLVAPGADPASATAPSTVEAEGAGNLFGHDFMAGAVTYLAGRLRSLPGRS